MKKLIWATIALLIVLSIGTASADEPSEMVKAFFKTVQDGNISDAYDNLFKGSPLPAMKPQALDLLKRQTSTYLPMYGTLLGVEPLRKETIGTAIMRIVYIMKLEKNAVVWEFFFYKPRDSWYLANINLNDEFRSMHRLEQSAQ